MTRKIDNALKILEGLKAILQALEKDILDKKNNSVNFRLLENKMDHQNIYTCSN